MNKTLLGGILCAFVMTACTLHEHSHNDSIHEEEHSHDNHAQEAAHGAANNEIFLSAERAQSAGVTIEEVKPSAFSHVIKVGGQILSAQGEETTVVANVAGVVSFGKNMIEGVHVSGGKEILSVSTDRLQNGSLLKQARIAYDIAKDEYMRASKLIDEQIVSKKEYNALRENYESARIAYEALTVGKDGKGIAVLAPRAGYIKTRMVNEGDYVAVGTPLVKITGTRRLQLRAEVPARYYSQLRYISSANFKTTYDDSVYALNNLHGKLIEYGKSLGSNNFYIPVTFEFDNTIDVLSGSFVEVFLLAASRADVISLPYSALTEEQGQYFVYKEIHDEHYERQSVQTGANDGSRVEIKSGLKPGDRVVTQGAIHVKLASASTSIPGHTHNH